MKKLNILHLYAASRQKADIGACLGAIIAEFNASIDFDFKASLAYDHYAMLQPVAMPPAMRSSLLGAVSSARYDVVVVCPPYDTFSRSVFSSWPGPKPLRDAQSPLGFGQLDANQQRRVTVANELLTFSLEIMRAAAGANSLALLTFPEDLGPARNGMPASLWQMTEARELEKDRLHQMCSFLG